MQRFSVLAVVVCLLRAALPPSAAAGPSDQEYPLDVDLGDRSDPVRPGEDIVYELEVENFTDANAPDVVVTDHLPPGTTYVIAHREPDWAVVPAIVDGDEVRFELGDVAPCDQADTPRCRDLWVVLRVDPSVPNGTLIENRVSVESSDPALPPNEATTVTMASSAAIRSVKLNVGRPGRDKAKINVDLARSGLYTPLDPPTPSVDLTQGISVQVGAPGEPPVFEIDLPAGEMKCSSDENPLRWVRCKLRDKKLWKPLGLKKLDVILPGYLSAQRSNAQVRMKLFGMDVPSDTGPEFEVVITAGGETFTHEVVLEPNKKGNRLLYKKGQGDL